MPKKNDRIVYRRSDGRWGNRRIGNERDTSIHETQKQASDEARRQIRKDGGGELSVTGRNHKIRSKDTISPGNDPNPPKDKEH